MKLNFSPETRKALQAIQTLAPELQKRKAEVKEQMRIERQCTGTTKNGERCRAWSVFGNPQNRCFRHGGAETAKLPRSERVPACTCGAYNFPHRRRSGFCNYPDEPLGKHPAPQGQRKYYKRMRKTQIKNWLKSLES